MKHVKGMTHLVKDVKAQVNGECARIRTSQETMNLVTTVTDMKYFNLNSMTGTVCEGTDEVCEGTDESKMCEDPHVPGNCEPGDDSDRYEILQLKQYDRHSL